MPAVEMPRVGGGTVFLEWSHVTYVRRDPGNGSRCFVGIVTPDSAEAPLAIALSYSAAGAALAAASGIEVDGNPVAPFATLTQYGQASANNLLVQSRNVTFLRADASAPVGSPRTFIALVSGEGPFLVSGSASAVSAIIDASQGEGGTGGGMDPLWQYVQQEGIGNSFDLSPITIGNVTDTSIGTTSARSPGGEKAHITLSVGITDGYALYPAVGTEDRPFPVGLPRRFTLSGVFDMSLGEATAPWFAGFFFGTVGPDDEFYGWTIGVRMEPDEGPMILGLGGAQFDAGVPQALEVLAPFSAPSIATMRLRLVVDVFLRPDVPTSGPSSGEPQMIATARVESLTQGGQSVSSAAIAGVTFEALSPATEWPSTTLIERMGVAIAGDAGLGAVVQLDVSDCSMWPRVTGGDYGPELD